ncbi:GTPase-associated system all-helical protein GASH [Hymenobacter ruricola]|uniref:GTPase-associated system helical domain-containing protein n=1 Tax=Hymenobacter ruricola TaxID=2791023 RepID=A0ABS0IA36_9BACT|nr:GTPase-associated system all-helical protein GASH [Hymenobacter ruricola]MBF9223774.1 hypothetical protein [Hymenobacter ruricola]
MAQSVLQDFLNQNLISIDQNEEFTFLSKTAADVEKRIGGKKSRIIQATLVAFDPQTIPEEPLVSEVQDMITSKWKAFPSKCHDRPIPYVRAVLLAALQKLAAQPELAGIIWLTASNYLPYADGVERETALLGEFLLDVGNTYQQAVERQWSVGGKTNLPTLPELKQVAITSAVTIKKEYATTKMTLAVNGNEEAGNNNVLSSFQSNYDGQKNIKPSAAWASSFGQLAGGFIKETADIIVNSINKSLAEVASTQQLTSYTEAITDYLRALGEQATQQTAAHNLRSHLLWLKESLYSESQQVSYRQLSVAAGSVALAMDLAALVPAVYPVSVEYFLREVLRAASAAMDTEISITFTELLAAWQVELGKMAEPLPAVVAPEPGRQPLLHFVRALAAGTTQPADFEFLTGLRLTDTLNWQQAGVWLFRELQAAKLASAK